MPKVTSFALQEYIYNCQQDTPTFWKIFGAETQLFVQQLIYANRIENIKVPYY